MDNMQKTRLLVGKEDFLIEVVGESYYANNLKSLCGGSANKTPDKMYLSELTCEEDNPNDKNAVKVSIFGNTVGHLSKDCARYFRSMLLQNGISDTVVSCYGKIVGGWRAEDGFVGNYGVRLDLPREYIEFVEFDFENNHSINFLFDLEHVDKKELKESQLGQKVNFWVKPSGAKKIYVYKSGSCGGAGYLGKVPLKYYYGLSDHLCSGLPFYAYICQLKKTPKIECELFSHEYVKAQALRKLSKRYRPRKGFEFYVILPKNTSMKLKERIYLKNESIESYANRWHGIQLNFTNENGKIVATKSYLDEKIIRLLRARFTGYNLSMHVTEIDFPDSTRIAFVDFIRATIKVEFS